MLVREVEAGGRADINAEGAPAAASVIQDRAKAAVFFCGLDAGHGAHVDSAVGTDFHAKAAANAGGQVIGVESPIGLGDHAVLNGPLDGEGLEEGALPDQKRGEEIFEFHGYLSISGG